MSQYIRGVPRDIALALRDTYGLNTFIETGTLVGYSARWAAKHFERVFTIEFFDEHYKLALNNLIEFKNVVCMKDLSVWGLEKLRDVWDGICCPLFWLDAHWTKGLRYGKPDQESDILNEISFVNLWRCRHAIIVDDAHKFSTEGWPELDYVIYLLAKYGERKVYRAYDVLVAVPIDCLPRINVTQSIDASTIERV